MDTTSHRDARYCLLLLVILGALYGACQNGQWLPGGGDDAFYLTIARNLGQGKGFVWDGAPVTLVPPGWPAVLAAAMRLSRSFWVLNLMLMFLCLGAACTWYWLIRHFASPTRAFAVVLIAGVLFEWHRFSFMHYSEALFYLLVAAALLVAVQVGQGRPSTWRVALLAALCAAMVAVRYAGLLLMPVVVGAAAAGQLRPKLNRQWAAVVLASAVAVGAFVGIRRAVQARAAVAMAEAADAVQRQKIDETVHFDSKINRGMLSKGPVSYLRRASLTGHWMSLLFWPPAVVSRTSRPLHVSVNVLGWLLVALYALSVPTALKQRQWIWPAGLLYVLLLPVLWGRPVARYYAPLAPLLLLGVWRGMEALGGPRQLSLASLRLGAPRQAVRIAAGFLLASVVACNGAILASSVWVARSGDFRDLCLAGEYREVLQVAEYLAGRTDGEAKLAVSAKYEDLNRTSAGFWVYRTLLFLTDRDVQMAPEKIARGGQEAAVLAWAEKAGARYVLTRAEHPVRRVWHFRLPLIGGSQEDRAAPFYVLKEIKHGVADRVEQPGEPGEQMVVVALPEVSSGLRRVPAPGSGIQ